MSLFYAVAIIVIVVSPLLVPLTITGVHGLANWRRRYAPRRTSIVLRRRAVTAA